MHIYNKAVFSSHLLCNLPSVECEDVGEVLQCWLTN
jgi:hypothetical protein